MNVRIHRRGTGFFRQGGQGGGKLGACIQAAQRGRTASELPWIMFYHLRQKVNSLRARNIPK